MSLGAHMSAHMSAHTSAHTSLGVQKSTHTSFGAHTIAHSSLGAHASAPMCAFSPRDPICTALSTSMYCNVLYGTVQALFSLYSSVQYVVELQFLILLCSCALSEGGDWLECKFDQHMISPGTAQDGEEVYKVVKQENKEHCLGCN